jgi:hypothetical protein
VKAPPVSAIIRIVLLAAIFAWADRPLQADETPAKLPKDGWWVRYFHTLKLQDREISSRRTYAFVGTAVERDCTCRWMEMQTVEIIDGHEVTDILKFLVPEKALLESERPLDGLIRCWRKFGDEQVEQVRFNTPLGERGLSFSADYAWGRDFTLFPGPQQKSKAVEEPRTIEYQRGRLEIETAQRFRRIASRRALTNGEKQEYSDEFTVWKDRSVTPAFAAATDRVQQHRDDALVRTFAIEFVLDDFGTDAKSALPDNQ